MRDERNRSYEKERFAPTSAAPVKLRGHFFRPAASKVVHQCAKTSNTTGHDHSEFGLINHRRRLIYFNTWFGRNDGFQIVQEDIPRFRVAGRKHKRNKVKTEKISSLSTSFFSSFAAFTNGVKYQQPITTKIFCSPINRLMSLSAKG